MSIAAEADFEWFWRSKIDKKMSTYVKKVIRKRLGKTIDFASRRAYNTNVTYNKVANAAQTADSISAAL